MTRTATAGDRPGLPLYPRLLPGLRVLDRGGGEIQIGLDPRHGVIADGIPPDLQHLLRGLDGGRSTGALLALADGEHAELLRRVLTDLAAHGLIEDAGGDPAERRPSVAHQWSLRSAAPGLPSPAQRAECTVALHGGGRLGAAVASLLAAAGIGHLDVHAGGEVTTDDLGSGYLDADLGTSKRTAMVKLIRRANPATRTSRVVGARLPELAVLTDTVVPAPETVRALMQEHVPHLPVRVRDGTGIVGPLVYPGRSSCLTCTDLHRRALDPAWPRIAGQLAGRYLEADLGSVLAIAGLAAGQVLAALTPGDVPPRLWNVTLELDPYEGTTREVRWQPHPDCACGAADVFAPPE